MPLTISDEQLKAMKMSEREARIEIACRLYTADKISKPEASRLAGLSRVELENELSKRGLPWIRLEWDETYAEEFERIRKAGAQSTNASERSGS